MSFLFIFIILVFKYECKLWSLILAKKISIIFEDTYNKKMTLKNFIYYIILIECYLMLIRYNYNILINVYLANMLLLYYFYHILLINTISFYESD